MTKKQALVVEKYVVKLLTLCGGGDNEAVHSYADYLLLDAFRELGFGQVADAWEQVREDVGFWYA